MSSLIERIASSHDHPNDDALQEGVLRDSFVYLTDLDASQHLFCNPNNYPVAIHALILFSFMQSEALEWYKVRIISSLSSCQDCVVRFHQGRLELKQAFLIKRRIEYSSVKEFNDIILSWESERVVKQLEGHLAYLQMADALPKVDIRLPLIECLYGPSMLRVTPMLKTLFSHCFINNLSSGALVPPSSIFPGLLYLIFEGTSDENLWALEFLKTISKIELADWDDLMNEEFLVHLLNIQDPQFYSDRNCIIFWTYFRPFLKLMTPEVIESKLLNIPGLELVGKGFPFQVVPLNTVLSNQLFAFLDSPLPVLLSILNIFISKLGSNFWKIVKPFTFINFLDPIFGSPHYIRLLRLPVPDQGPQPIYEITDLFAWISSLYNSIPSTAPQKQQAGLRITAFLLSQVHNGINNGFIIDCAFAILSDISKIENHLYDSKLGLELLSKVDTRTFINMKTQILVDIARGGNNYKPSLDITSIEQVTNKLRSRAIIIIANAILYDIYYFAEKGNSLKGNKTVNLGTTSNSVNFWDGLTSKFKPNDIPFASEIFKVLSKICCIVPINEKLFIMKHELQDSSNKNNSILSQIKQYNSDISVMFNNVRKLLDRFNTFDGAALKSILIEPRSALGYWSCMLSSNKDIYQSATNLLYEAFDVEGRAEGVKSILSANQHAALHSLHKQLSWLIAIDSYDPCPSAVRVLMDIVSALNNSVDGVFIEMIRSPIPAAVVEDLRLFWKKCWLFLDFIYRKTLNWAQVFPASLLTDFTRDTLDLSHMLIDCYNIVESIVKEDELFKDVMNTFQNMLVWLRLGDMSLLSSCVSLIFKTLDLSEEKKLPMSRNIIELLAKYGAKAKRFNNKLTEKQRIDILDKASSFDEDLVQEVIESATGYRRDAANKEKSTHVQPEVVEIDDDDDDDENIVEVRGNRTESRKIKQTDLSRFITNSNTMPVAPAPKQPPQKTSLLAAAKATLANKRINATKLASAPAPPRPSGFNRKKAVGSDSESSDSDSNDEMDSLFHPIKKDRTINKVKSKVMSLPPKSLTVNRTHQKKQVDQKELDAFNMRMRLNVDLNPLYKHVLSWSYSKSGDFPEDLKDKADVYKRISDSFKNYQEYTATFEPLLLLECWQSIQQSKQIGQESAFPIVVASRSTTNAFFEVYASIRREIVQDKKLSDSDLIVLSFNPEFTSNTDKKAAPSREAIKNSKQSCLAKIKEIKMVNPEFCDVTLRVSSKSNPLASFLTPRTELFGMKVMQMITIEREYSSLKGLQYYDLSKQIVQAIPNIPEKLDQSEKDKMINLYDVNPSQAQAIAGSVHADGFSLIQGPPGTGKTKTILGIIGYILTAAINRAVQPINIPGMKNSDQTQTRKNKNVLICAPSNAAVDELVLRLRSGIKNASGEIFHPSVVRLGRSDAVNPAVKDLTLEELIDKELSSKEGTAPVSADPKIREEHNKCIQERNKIKDELIKDGLTPEQVDSLNQRLRKCVQRKNELGKQLDEQRENISKSNRTREYERRALQAKFLTQAQVICSTLSGSAHDMLASLSLSFDTVIIDEAAQCIELSAIIPLRYGCKKCIMVGDPNQLPPTVLSQAAASYAYEQSLFVRMQTQHPDSVYLLDVQYRMHPEISKFPSVQFYDSKLIDGPNMKELNTRPWHRDDAFKPYLFYNTVGAMQSQNQRTKSFFNTVEAKVALELVEKLFRDYYNENWTGRIGIISPYKEQINMLRDLFIKKFGRGILREIDFNTVDGFQGQEKEVIIMSCVRASESYGVGFLSDVRRMNVALTRSKTSLWILGSKSSLSKNKVWSNLISDAENRESFYNVSPGFLKNPGHLKSTVYPAASDSLKEQIASEQNAVSKPVIAATKSGSIPPNSKSLPKLSQTKDNSKPKSRVTLPYTKPKRNILTAESIKAASRPSSSGNLPTEGAKSLPEKANAAKKTSEVLPKEGSDTIKTVSQPSSSGSLPTEDSEKVSSTPKPSASGNLSEKSRETSREASVNAVPADPRLRRKDVKQADDSSSNASPVPTAAVPATDHGVIPSSTAVLPPSVSHRETTDGLPTDPRLKRKLELQDGSKAKMAKVFPNEQARTYQSPSSGFIPPLTRPQEIPNNQNTPPSTKAEVNSRFQNAQARGGFIADPGKAQSFTPAVPSANPQGRYSNPISNPYPYQYQSNYQGPNNARNSKPGPFKANPATANNSQQYVPPPSGPKKYQQPNKYDKYNYHSRSNNAQYNGGQYNGGQYNSDQYNSNHFNNQYSNNQYSNSYNSAAADGDAYDDAQRRRTNKKPNFKKNKHLQSGNLPPR